MALPWGFMYAGAPVVVASLWNVDDRATALLMSRFFENLHGQYSDRRSGFTPGALLPTDAALREAKQWLRSLGAHEARLALRALGIEAPKTASDSPRTAPKRASISAELPGPPLEQPGDQFDFSHPHYWGAFVLIGAPD